MWVGRGGGWGFCGAPVNIHVVIAERLGQNNRTSRVVGRSVRFELAMTFDNIEILGDEERFR